MYVRKPCISYGYVMVLLCKQVFVLLGINVRFSIIHGTGAVNLRTVTVTCYYVLWMRNRRNLLERA